MLFAGCLFGSPISTEGAAGNSLNQKNYKIKSSLKLPGADPGQQSVAFTFKPTLLALMHFGWFYFFGGLQREHREGENFVAVPSHNQMSLQGLRENVQIKCCDFTICRWHVVHGTSANFSNRPCPSPPHSVPITLCCHLHICDILWQWPACIPISSPLHCGFLKSRGCVLFIFISNSCIKSA